MDAVRTQEKWFENIKVERLTCLCYTNSLCNAGVRETRKAENIANKCVEEMSSALSLMSFLNPATTFSVRRHDAEVPR